MEIEEELKKAFNTKIDLINVKRLNPLVRMNAQKDFIYV
jgi:predicted nucleotidyltransferase